MPLPAFQACAQLAAACGVTLEVPPGKYWLNGTLHLSLETVTSRDGSLHVMGTAAGRDTGRDRDAYTRRKGVCEQRSKYA